MTKIAISAPLVEYDMALNSKLIRLSQLGDTFVTTTQRKVLSDRQRHVCLNSLTGEMIALRQDIEKMCNGEDHQNEKQSPTKSK